MTGGERFALMSIRPKYVASILAGTKRIEFRKRRLADDIERVAIYCTSPISAVVGEFEVLGQVTGRPPELWALSDPNKTGVTPDEFFAYYGESEATAIIIGKVTEYAKPRRLIVYGLERPPQSFQYLDSPREGSSW